jgi:hypothetical protein
MKEEVIEDSSALRSRCRKQERKMKFLRPMLSISRSWKHRTEFSSCSSWTCKMTECPIVIRLLRRVITIFDMEQRPNQDSQIHASEKSATVSGLA